MQDKQIAHICHNCGKANLRNYHNSNFTESWPFEVTLRKCVYLINNRYLQKQRMEVHFKSDIIC